MVRKKIPSYYVAMKEQIFGEGAERIVRKCRFLDKYGNFTGPVMVAKESRFVDESENDDSYDKRMEYHKEFMRTQGMAASMAKEFNAALESISKHFQEPQIVENYIQNIPNLKFLEPFVVETNSEGIEYNVLVEPMLEEEYKKFNDNMGLVRGQNKSVSVDDLSSAMGNLAYWEWPFCWRHWPRYDCRRGKRERR
mmetsp:Transcript_13076/g.15939  ORF Transcript_13076/g.15939 Transcript_13076/m.15939 type:complete len:195 (+) Transcript_13076:596-1180(+)